MKRYHSYLLILLLSLLSCQPDRNRTEQTDTEAPLPPETADYEESDYKWGFIDRSGALRIDTRFDEVRDFSQAYAVVRTGAYWGFIDKQGDYLIKPTYKGAWSFSDGLARVQTYQDSFGYVDRQGTLAIPVQFVQASDFDAGLARVQIGQRYGFIDRQGSLLIPAEYEDLNATFSEGFTTYQRADAYGLLHRGGRELSIDCEGIRPPKDGRARIRQGDTYGYADTTGSIVIPPRFERASDFAERRAAVKENGQYGLIDREGLYVVEPEYDMIRYAGQSRWLVRRGNRFGAIDAQGDLRIPVEYEQIYPFSGERAAYLENDRWGYLDLDGQRVTPPQFALCWSHQNGWARAATYQGICYVDRQGKIALQAPFRDIRDFSEGLARVQALR